MTIHVVVGPPCSGKSTYVREHAKRGDVRVDFDLMAQALGSDVAHKSEGAIRDVTFAARSAAIDRCIEKGHEAWVIHSSPSQAQMERYRACDAEFVELDPGIDECIRRASEDNRPDGEEQDIRGWYASREKGFLRMNTKTFAATVKEVGDSGEITAYASTFDREPDSYGDVVAKGAFSDTLKAHADAGEKIPLLFGHVTTDPDYIIGEVTSAEEDERGLLVHAMFNGGEKAQTARSRVLDGTLTKLSFAYDVLDQAPVTLSDGTKVNELRKLELFEVSLVPIPANQHAEVIDAKSAEPETKSGRTFSKSNEDELHAIKDLLSQASLAIDGLLSQLDMDEPNEGPDGDETEANGCKPKEPKSSNAELVARINEIIEKG